MLKSKGGEGVNREEEPIWEGGGGGLFNLAKTIVSVLHKKLECKVGKIQYKKLKVMRQRIKKNAELPAGE